MSLGLRREKSGKFVIKLEHSNVGACGRLLPGEGGCAPQSAQPTIPPTPHLELPKFI
jgi:hypothetical protein